MNRFVFGLTAALLLVGSGRADAAFIRMEGIARSGTLRHGHDQDSAFREVLNRNRPNNGTDWLVNDNRLGVTFTDAPNGTFSMQSFDATEWEGGFTGGRVITVLGTYAGGGTISMSFTTLARSDGRTPRFQTFDFGAGWENLAHVTITQASLAMARDNVQVNDRVPPVPTPPNDRVPPIPTPPNARLTTNPAPPSVVLLAVGLVTLGGLRLLRRKTQSVA